MRTEKIWKQYSEEVLRFIISRVKDLDLANDLLQETFIKIHLKKEELQEEEKLKTWVFSIASNTTHDYFRKKKLSIDPGEFPQETSEDTAHSPHDCLQPLIKKLPHRYREALMLADIQGMKQADVAKKLNISLSGAKSRVQRGRKLVQEGYIDCCDYKLRDGVLVGETKPQKDCKVCG